MHPHGNKRLFSRETRERLETYLLILEILSLVNGYF
jgi:hypothetical protein